LAHARWFTPRPASNRIVGSPVSVGPTHTRCIVRPPTSKSPTSSVEALPLALDEGALDEGALDEGALDAGALDAVDPPQAASTTVRIARPVERGGMVRGV
jgi:hypothetical protein